MKNTGVADSVQRDDFPSIGDSKRTTPPSSYDSGEESSDSPQELIRKEDNAVAFLRVLTIAFLSVAAGVTGGMVYRFSSKAEAEAFDRRFEEVSSKIVEALLEETAKKFWYARTTAASIAAVMSVTGDKPWTMTIPMWEEITEEARFVSDANVVAWSPFLYNEEEKEEFYNYTSTFLEGRAPLPGPNPPCSVCEEGTVVIEGGSGVNLGGKIVSCTDIEGAGLQGSISRCDLVKEASKGNCNCGLPLEGASNFPPRTTEEGMWMMDPSGSGYAVDDATSPPWNPMWNVAIRGDTKGTFLFNQMSDPLRRDALEAMIKYKVPSFTEMYRREGDYYENYVEGRLGEMATTMVYPIFGLDSDDIIGSITVDMVWKTFVPTVFPPESDLVDVVISNSCGQEFTFRIDERSDQLIFQGEREYNEDFEDQFVGTSFEQYDKIIEFASGRSPETKAALNEFCRYQFFVYPTTELRDQYITMKPAIYTTVVSLIFVFTGIVIFMYDAVVRRRQKVVMDRALRTGAIVHSLFPKVIRDRLYKADIDTPKQGSAKDGFMAAKHHLKNFMIHADDEGLSQPLADFFPNATVLFIDIANFTAWASERSPTQVFILLETIFQQFDEIAEQHDIFKVETVGDSYVAVTGVPAARTDHAVSMIRFAYTALRKMEDTVKELETQLGPSTGELRCRCGVHSGPVTAGVLRGAKARFQLFGDTVNTSSRMESCGAVGLIHISSSTAEALRAAGKDHWITPRNEVISVKGKGEVETFWANPVGDGRKSPGSVRSMLSYEQSSTEDTEDMEKHDRVSRLIDWNVQVLFSMLESIVDRRGAEPRRTTGEDLSLIHQAEVAISSRTGIVFDEIIPVFDTRAWGGVPSSSSVEAPQLPPEVKLQLHEFVEQISLMYHDVPFHNFEHASHVTMSTGKLMQRIVQPDGVDYDRNPHDVAKDVHDMTYGISSDPLMQFSIAFAALIHDADHTGLPNAELVKMKTAAAVAYRDRSVAEQNSVDVAWALLMKDEFRALRSCIYATVDELKRFRQFVVNAVMATDIADKELQDLRRTRWAKAFDDNIAITDPSSTQLVKEMEGEDVARRATIVFEYIIQASDVCHTMQHWRTYLKWNERLFQERYKAYLKGHETEDPAVGWYRGEIGFYDFYIIPLAKKLDECGVFGVSHDEYLGYAQANRAEWEREGKDIVAAMHLRAVRSYGYLPSPVDKHGTNADRDTRSNRSRNIHI